MIEKITPDHILGLDGLPTTIMPDSAKLMRKINELVDAVNELQESLNTYWTDIGEIKAKIAKGFENLKEPADPYAEQRKWICKLCWFWNENYEDGVIGVLTGVFDNADRPFESNINQTLYKHCEPVKPDDDIIYKGRQ